MLTCFINAIFSLATFILLFLHVPLNYHPINQKKNYCGDYVKFILLGLQIFYNLLGNLL